MVREVNSLEVVEEAIASELGVLLYLSAPTCNVCKVLKPKIVEAVTDNFPVIKVYSIDTAISSDIAARYHVFSLPTVILFLDRKEFAREGRNMSLPLFIEKIDRVYKLLTEDI
jgi:thioredoxin-like negative regulator of GroEL